MRGTPPLAALAVHEGTNPVVIGAGAATSSLPRLGVDKRSLIIADGRLLDLHPLLTSRFRHVVRADVEKETQEGLLERARGSIERSAEAPSAVVGIGGGSVMDAAKLTRLLLRGDSGFQSMRRSAGRLGVALLPPTSGADVPPLILVPTTLGTGSEASSVACLDGGGSRLLVAGAAMKADFAVLDPELTRSLPAAAILEGAAEILLRVLGVWAGSRRAELQDAVATDLVRTVCRTVRDAAAGPFDDRHRLRLAVASADTHRGWALVGRNPYGAKHWYLANELSAASGHRKVPVTFRLLPGIWRRATEGDARFGDGQRLVRIWRVVAEELSLPSEPVQGCREWASAWGVPEPPFSPADAAVAARRCAALWGGDRPALRGLWETDIAEVYAEASEGANDDVPMTVRR
ncbi:MULTISPECIES: iron-containing alcohol dehydrogenase [Bacteria]|uniref:iron-containing alcohol dehydrogenase n=1 Tax=Bacteria TaxID=2 RepID=UPI003C7A585E